MYKALGAKLVVGMPFKDIATSDSIFLRSLPEQSDAQGQRALRRLQVSVVSPHDRFRRMQSNQTV